MKKREFIKKGLLSTAGLLLTNKSAIAKIIPERFPELADHKVTNAELETVTFHWPRFVGRNGTKDIHGQYNERTVLKIYTDQGAMGWGISDKRASAELTSILGRKVSDLINPEFGLSQGLNTFYFDLPLYDLAGVILNKPVYQLLGGSGPKEVSVYSGMIYMDELASEGLVGSIDRVLENCAWDYNYGYRQLKIKIGRGKRWYSPEEGMKMDIRIVKMIFEAYQEKGVQLMVDANNAYSLNDTKTFLEGIDGIPLFWVEEPFPENLEEGYELRKWMDSNGYKDTRYADGEWIMPDVDNDIALEMVEKGILNTYVNDIHAYGITNWIKAMPMLRQAKATGSPHTWGDRLKTHYTVHLAAGLGNIPTVEGVTCLSEDIDYGEYPVNNGNILVSSKPGFGMTLLK